MKSSAGQFTKRVQHDCEKPERLVKRVEYMKRPPWYLPFAKPVLATKEVVSRDSVCWVCPECNSSWRWSPYAGMWSREIASGETRILRADSPEALDKMGWD